MGLLYERIKEAVAAGNYVISDHATDRLAERRIPEWQVASGLASARLGTERPGDKPNPSIEVEELLADGTPVLVVWAWLPISRLARLVTVHFFDG